MTDQPDPGYLIRAARHEAGIRQRDLARVAGVHQSIISRIESGRQEPTLREATRLLGLLGVRVRLVVE